MPYLFCKALVCIFALWETFWPLLTSRGMRIEADGSHLVTCCAVYLGQQALMSKSCCGFLEFLPLYLEKEADLCGSFGKSYIRGHHYAYWPWSYSCFSDLVSKSASLVPFLSRSRILQVHSMLFSRLMSLHVENKTCACNSLRQVVGSAFI